MRDIETRFLTTDDIDTLMNLEKQQWTGDQLPSKETLIARIKAYPNLSIGAFCCDTGQALASLFLKPFHMPQGTKNFTWNDCAKVEGLIDTQGKKTRDLFGISLTSIDAQAGDFIFSFFYSCCMKEGWRSVYLGSPIPGYKKSVTKNSRMSVEDYVNKKYKNMPYDPQLRYYFKRGFQRIVLIQKDYFPHKKALDYGVILEGRVPLYRLSVFWQYLPHTWLQTMCKTAIRFTHKFKTFKHATVQLVT